MKLRNLKRQGLDAPLVPILYILTGIAAILYAVIFHTRYTGYWWTIFYGILMIAGGILFIHTSIRGKKIIWDNIIQQLDIPKNSHVLDLGTGHGLVLLKFARKLSIDGHATGIDLWRNQDQSDNSIENTQAIITSNHLNDIADVQTADMLDLPFEDNQYDYVVSSLALHNIKPATSRKKALIEASRVLKPNGKLILVDTSHHRHEYIQTLIDLGYTIQTSKTYGMIGWWSGPWMATYSVIATQS